MSDERDSVGGVTIGAREIYDVVVSLRDDVRALTQTNEAVNETLKDHETRIRGLERWRYTLPASLVLAAGSAVATILRAVGAL
ncbi:hypothetical protein [Streptomyces sp. NPDC101393]|uniref:hypothetical protein n=1 Tax=Streptomyces sp. NPDC101393 TaxID=3366141 RepID=UPI0037FCE056